MNDPDVLEHLDSARKPVSKYNLQKYYERVMDSDTEIMFAVVEKASEKHIGNVKLTKIDLLHRQANYGRMIGDKTSWGKGYGTEILKLIMDYAFNKLNLNRIYTPVYEDNVRSIRSNEKAGMVKEGVSYQARYVNGQYKNIVNFAMTKDRYLKLYGNNKKSQTRATGLSNFANKNIKNRIH